MRYIFQPKIIFLDKNGIKHTIKQIPEITQYETAFKLKDIPQDMELDEIASRQEIFGEGMEYLSYALWYHNIEKIVENNFDFTKLKELKIPIVRNT